MKHHVKDMITSSFACIGTAITTALARISVDNLKESVPEKYIHQLDSYNELRDKTIVAIDPNKLKKNDDVIFATDEKKCFAFLPLRGALRAGLRPTILKDKGLIPQNRFEERFGGPETTLIGMGDFEQKTQMKFKEPVKAKGFRNLLRKRGYEVFLVDEFRTICRCFHEISPLWG